MPKCGYHPRMGVGLTEIAAGLADAVKIKADAHSRSISDQLSFEQEEFVVVRTIVRRRMEQASSSEERMRLEAFDAMLLLGEYFLNLRNSTKSNNLHSEVDGRAEAFINFLKHFDEVWKKDHLDKSVAERADHALSCSLRGKDTLAA